MNPGAGINLTTCQDYPLSLLVKALLSEGVEWQLSPDKQEFCYDYFMEGSESNYGLWRPMSEQQEVLLELDKKQQEGFLVQAMLVVDDIAITLAQYKPNNFYIFLFDRRPQIEKTWLTDYTWIASKFLVPLLKKGFCFLTVTYEDENF